MNTLTINCREDVCIFTGLLLLCFRAKGKSQAGFTITEVSAVSTNHLCEQFRLCTFVKVAQKPKL